MRMYMSTKEWREQNKDKVLAYRREWYARNKKSEVADNLQRRKVLVEWFKNYKRTLKCQDCSESDPVCLDFHHKNPSEKEYPVTEMPRRGFSKEKILTEINKCSVLCANCHRKHHRKDFGY